MSLRRSECIKSPVHKQSPPSCFQAAALLPKSWFCNRGVVWQNHPTLKLKTAAVLWAQQIYLLYLWSFTSAACWCQIFLKVQWPMGELQSWTSWPLVSKNHIYTGEDLVLQPRHLMRRLLYTMTTAESSTRSKYSRLSSCSMASDVSVNASLAQGWVCSCSF